jgi:rubrerythrin
LRALENIDPIGLYFILTEEEEMQAILSERELIQVAINREKTSFALYSCAAVQADSEKVKKVFNRIARDELLHLFTLLSRFERVYPELCNEVNIIMPIPEEAEVRRLATIKESAEALRGAIREEQQSLQFYLQLANVVEDEGARIALQRIIHDETNHIKALSSLGDEEIDEATVEEKRFH